MAMNSAAAPGIYPSFSPPTTQSSMVDPMQPISTTQPAPNAAAIYGMPAPAANPLAAPPTDMSNGLPMTQQSTQFADPIAQYGMAPTTQPFDPNSANLGPALGATSPTGQPGFMATA